MGYLGTWVDVYADDPDEPDNEVINVAYDTATLRDDAVASPDPLEVSEVRWFAWDALPSELSPPGTLESVLAAARVASGEASLAPTSPEGGRPR